VSPGVARHDVSVPASSRARPRGNSLRRTMATV
jgi:hypothetical protein